MSALAVTDEKIPFTFAHRDGYTQVHARGCTAASRRGRWGHETPCNDHAFTMAEVEAMATNPDEGDLTFHACTGISPKIHRAWKRLKLELIG